MTRGIDPDEWISTGAVAWLLETSDDTVKRRLKGGVEPRMTPGGLRQYRRGDVNRWALLEPLGRDVSRFVIPEKLGDALPPSHPSWEWNRE